MADPLEILKAEMARREAMASLEKAVSGGAPPNYAHIANDDSGGTVYMRPDQRYEYVAPGVSRVMDELPRNINDIPGIIRGGATQDYEDEVYDKSPVASHMAAAISGTPFAGEWLDNMLPDAWGDKMRAGQNAVERKHPWRDVGLKMTGGVAGSLPLAVAAPGGMLLGAKGILGRALAGGLTGLGLGATDAALAKAGDNDDAPSRWDGVDESAVFGGGLGGLLGMLLGPASLSAGALVKRFSKPGRDAARSADEIELNRTGSGLVNRAVDLDEENALANFDAAGRYAVNAHAGPNTAGLLDLAINRPFSAAKNAAYRLNAIASQAGRDFTELMDSSFGVPKGLNRTKAEIMTESAPIRQSTYASAYGATPNWNAPQGVELMGYLDRIPQKVIDRANALLKVEGNGGRQIITSVDDAGRVVFHNPPGVREWDYMTRALRDMGDWTGEGGELGRAHAQLAKDIRLKLDELVPEYKAARAAGGDAIAMREALDLGADAFRKNMTRETLEDAVDGMTGPELTSLKTGVRAYADELMANVNMSLTDVNMDAREAVGMLNKVFLTRAGQDKLRFILGDEADSVIAQMKEVHKALELRALIAQNSKTYMRTEGDKIVKDAVPPTFTEELQAGKGVLGAGASKLSPYINAGAPSRDERMSSVMATIADSLLLPPRRVKDPGLPSILNMHRNRGLADILGQKTTRNLDMGILPLIMGAQPPDPSQR